MHYAKLSESKRLQRVLALLSDYRPHTTREIIESANVCAVNSIKAELKANGIPVDCRFVRRTNEGASVYEYQLLKVADTGQVEMCL